jgi:hypothetical protein
MRALGTREAGVPLLSSHHQRKSSSFCSHSSVLWFFTCILQAEELMVRHWSGTLARAGSCDPLISIIVGFMPTASRDAFMTQNYDIKTNLTSKICASDARPASTSL